MDDIRQKLVISQDSFLGLRNIEAILSKKWIQHRKLGAYRIVGLEKRLLWGALWAMPSRATEKLALFSQRRLGIGAAAEDGSFRNILFCLQPGEQAPTSPWSFHLHSLRAVTGHWRAAADSRTCQERQPENISISILQILCDPLPEGILGFVVS